MNRLTFGILRNKNMSPNHKVKFYIVMDIYYCKGESVGTPRMHIFINKDR